MTRPLIPLLVITGLMFGHTTTARAQDYIGILTYSYALPTGDTDDFIDNDSWLGATLEGQWFVGQSSTVGLLFGWNEFYHKVQGDIDFDFGTVSGTQYRHLNIFPMMVTAHWFGGERGGARPFIGLGVGTDYVRQLLDVGLREFTESNWHFALAPDAGIAFPLPSGSALVLAARYNYPFKAGDYIGGGSRAFQYLSFHIGVAYSR